MPKEYKAQIKKLPKSEVEIKGEIESLLLADARKKALKKFSDSLDLPGFRKGHVPDNIVVEKVGEGRLLEDAADILLNEYYPKIITENDLDTIGRPKVTITKLALGNPVEFTITSAILPEFELGNFPEISKQARESNPESEKDLEVSEKEVDDVVAEIEKNKIKHDFKDAARLRAKIKENITTEKKMRQIEKRRAAIMDALLAETKIDLPEILIESEVEKSLAQMKDDVARVGAKFEDYLRDVKKTEEELKKDLRLGSEKKAKIQLILNKIALIGKLEPNKEILEHEVKQILEHYPEARRENAHIYVTTQLLNQEVLKLLENQN